MNGDIREFLAAHRDEMVRQLVGWIRIRSVAGVPERGPDLIRSANWLSGELRATGFPAVEVWKVDGAPAVYAEWCAAPGAPTVLVYSHHDVRAATDELWEETPPFEPAVRDGRVYGRGASDAKGQIVSHLLPALAALTAAMEDGFGQRPGRMGNAGGGPAELLSRVLGVPVMFFGIGLLEDRWHDSDERVSVEMLVGGAATLAHLWPRLAGPAS